MHWFVIYAATTDRITPSPAGCSFSQVDGDTGRAVGANIHIHDYIERNWKQRWTYVSESITTSVATFVGVFIMKHHRLIVPPRARCSAASRSQITACPQNPQPSQYCIYVWMNIWSAARDKSFIPLAATLLHLRSCFELLIYLSQHGSLV